MSANPSASSDAADAPRTPLPGRVDLRVPAIAAKVPELRQVVRRFAIMVGVRAPDEVALAVTEALTNAILHAYRGTATGDMRVVACDHPGQMVLVVRDYGCGMSPHPDSPGIGMGLAIMGRSGASVTVERPDDGGTRLRMHFTKT